MRNKIAAMAIATALVLTPYNINFKNFREMPAVEHIQGIIKEIKSANGAYR